MILQSIMQVSEDNCHHSSMSSSGTSGKSPSPSEDLESKTNASASYSCTPSKTSAANVSTMSSTSEISPASNNSTGTSKENSPSQIEDLEREKRLLRNRAKCAPLLQAAMKADWPAAKKFLQKNQDCVRLPITRENATALHIAAAAQHTTFVKELLELMEPEDLELETSYGYTTLHSAAQSGNVDIAEQLVGKNKKLLSIPNQEKEMPLHVAAFLGQKKMVSHLFSKTFTVLNRVQRIDLLHYTIRTDMYDIALKIVKEDIELATHVEDGDGPYGWTALEELAKKTFAIGSESRPSFWKSRLNSWFKGVHNKALTKTRGDYHDLVDDLWKSVHNLEKQLPSNLDHYDVTVIFKAAEVGNVEFLIAVARSYPDILWQQDKNQKSIFHIAVLYRQESVFNLIYEIGGNKDSLAAYETLDTKDNMLHLAGRLAPSHRRNIVSGPALQMQREFLWFKEIEKIVPRSCVNSLNVHKETPKEVFIKTHSRLQKKGEQWMRDTANNCMLVATLIATVVFAATFTVPGGSNQDTGNPILLKSIWFNIFFISDAIALCFSSMSIVIFLSILTSRYTEEEFLKSLPSKLVFGLATLFISMAGMMVAFSATCFLVYKSVKAWAPIVVITLASIPIIWLVLLHYKLWVDTFLSTYNSRFLFRPNQHKLFQQKMQGKQDEEKINRGSSDIENGKVK